MSPAIINSRFLTDEQITAKLNRQYIHRLRFHGGEFKKKLSITLNTVLDDFKRSNRSGSPRSIRDKLDSTTKRDFNRALSAAARVTQVKPSRKASQ